MTRAKWRRAAGLVVVGLWLGGCGGSGQGGETAPGTPGGACTAGDACDPGLECVEGMCWPVVDPGTEGTACYADETCDAGFVCVGGLCGRSASLQCKPGTVTPCFCPGGGLGEAYCTSGRALGACDCALTDTCVAGYHDGGDGTCVPASMCVAGYHDGGDGSCVPVGTCLAGYDDGGYGICAPAGTCASGCHDAGDGTCAVMGSCASGYHDGGEGTCVALNTCSTGYGAAGDGSCARPAAITSFMADPTLIRPGDYAYLRWSTTNATRIELTDASGTSVLVGDASTNGTRVYPVETTTYTLTAAGEGGDATADVTVEVLYH